MNEDLLCPSCRKANPRTNIFCYECGNNLHEAVSSIKEVSTKYPNLDFIAQLHFDTPQTTKQYNKEPNLQHRSREEINFAAIISFICSIVALGIAVIPYLNFTSPFFILIAVILGILGLSNPHQKTLAYASLFVSVFAIVAFVILVVVYLKYLFPGFF